MAIEAIFKYYNKYHKFNFIQIFVKYLYYRIFFGKKILVNENVKILNVKNILSDHFLEIGLNSAGFVHKSEQTFLNLKGKLVLNGKYSIGRGCKIDIDDGGVVSIGTGGYVNSYTKIIISHGLKIGNNCIISWDCQFLDNDFHEIFYDDKVENKNEGIVIGDDVWVGCGVKIYKGTYIANNCVIASDSVVKGVFDRENSLIGGQPAKVIKENIRWR